MRAFPHRHRAAAELKSGVDMKYSSWVDEIVEQSSRSMAARGSRRSFLARLGSALIGAAALPLLPVSRLANAEAGESPAPGTTFLPPGTASSGTGTDWNNPKSCEYWAFCATAGWLCTACGGTSSQCPPGTEMSPIAWVGTCKNPGDGKSYVVSYHDCCGKSQCGIGFCERSEGATARYRMQRSNSVTWCFGGVSSTYHCTVSRLLSVAQ
jgi:methylamine dehydrogenase light chain